MKEVSLDELQREMEKLVALLKERQYGQISWHMFLNERLKNLYFILNAVGLPAQMPEKKDNIYPISVDYERSVEDGRKAGRYYWSNPDITSRNFPTKRNGKAEVAVELIHFNRIVSTDEALCELDRIGYRPAELHELLAFGEKYPEVQREFPVVALGSVWRIRHSVRRSFPCLRMRGYMHGSRRSLSLRRSGFYWLEIFRFAAVRK